MVVRKCIFLFIQIWFLIKSEINLKTRGKEMFNFLGVFLLTSTSDPPTERDFTVAYHLSKMSQCQDFLIFTFCPLQCDSISCCALSTAVHHLPNNSCHLLGNAAPPDICPAGEGFPYSFTELSRAR